MKKKIKMITSMLAMWLIILASVIGAGWLVATIHLTIGWWAIGKLCVAFSLIGFAWCCGEYAIVDMIPRKKKNNDNHSF